MIRHPLFGEDESQSTIRTIQHAKRAFNSFSLSATTTVYNGMPSSGGGLFDAVTDTYYLVLNPDYKQSLPSRVTPLAACILSNTINLQSQERQFVSQVSTYYF